MQSLIDKIKRGEDLTEDECQILGANFIFGHIVFKLQEKTYKEYKDTIKGYLKNHGRRIETRHPLFALELEERVHRKEINDEWVIDQLTYEDLKTILLNSKIRWNEKALAKFIPQDQLDAHKTEKTAEYLLPKIRKDVRIDWDEEDAKLKPKELRMNNSYVKQLITDNSPDLLIRGG